MDGRGVHRAEPDSGEGGTGDDGKDVECPSAPARSLGRKVRAKRSRRSRVRRGSHCVSTSDMLEIEKRIDSLAATPSGAALPDEARNVVAILLDALEAGTVRAAVKDPNTGDWRAVPWVKR